MKKEKNPTLTVSNIARLLYCEQQVFFEKKYKKASKSKKLQETQHSSTNSSTTKLTTSSQQQKKQLINTLDIDKEIELMFANLKNPHKKPDGTSWYSV